MKDQNAQSRKNEIIIFVSKHQSKQHKNKFYYVGKDIDGKDYTKIVNNQKKLKYAYENNGVIRGRLVKSIDNTITSEFYKFRAIKEKFIKSLRPKTLEEVEIEETRKHNEVTYE